MKRSLTLLTLMAFILVPGMAFASDSYFGIKGGLTEVDLKATLNYDGDEYGFSSLHKPWGLGIVAGTTLTKSSSMNLRLEIENYSRFGKYQAERLDLDSDYIEVKYSNSTLLSLFMDFPMGSVTPYIGGTAGLLLFDYKATSEYSFPSGVVTKDGIGAAFQYGLSAGMALHVSQNLALDINGRILWDTGYNVDLGDQVDWDFDIEQPMAEFGVGLRFYF